MRRATSDPSRDGGISWGETATLEKHQLPNFTAKSRSHRLTSCRKYTHYPGSSLAAASTLARLRGAGHHPAVVSAGAAICPWAVGSSAEVCGCIVHVSHRHIITKIALSEGRSCVPSWRLSCIGVVVSRLPAWAPVWWRSSTAAAAEGS